MAEFHEATFRWPHAGASEVIVTGTFDGWSRSIHLPRSSSGFEGPVKVPWADKILYKYVVDGQWLTTSDQPTETDPIGNVNNVYHPPPKPVSSTFDESPAVLPAASVEPTRVESAVKTITNIEPIDVDQTPVKMFVEEPSSVIAVVGIPTVIVESAPAATPDPGPTPIAEPTASILPTPPEKSAVAPIVPVPITFLGAAAEITPPSANGMASKSPDTEVAKDVAAAAAAMTEEPSTHQPLPPMNGTSSSPAKDDSAPIINGTPVPSTPPMNGATIATAPATPPKDVPTTPNGKHKQTPSLAPSTTSSPSTPGKEKRMRFPSLGHAHSRASSVSEHGENTSPGKESVGRFANKKRTSSIFGKFKSIFQTPEKD